MESGVFFGHAARVKSDDQLSRYGDFTVLRGGKMDELLDDWLTSVAGDAIVVEGMDEAIIGIDCAEGGVVYDYQKCLNCLVLGKGLSLTDAVEYMETQLLGVELGVGSPVFIKSFGADA
jgi:hypothetical protein